MRILQIFFLLLLFTFHANAQGLSNYWMFGYNKVAGIPWGPSTMDFYNGSPSIYFDSARNMSFNFTGASISDSSGNLLFYTNGVYIANRFHQPMLNGTGISPSSYTTQQAQHDDGMRITTAAIILPFPEHKDQFILIHETPDDNTYPFPSHLYYSIIDMQGDNGKGEVVLKNQILINDTIGLGELVACKHANGRDWWIVVPKALKNGYYLSLLTPSGINVESYQNIGTKDSSYGQASFSLDGSTYVSYDTYTDLEVLDFDRCTGLFSNARHVSMSNPYVCYGVAFSPSGRKIYASSTKELFQFDLDKPNLADYDTVAIWDSTYSPFPPLGTFFFSQALRPDGKIYITTGNGTDRMHTIDYPDSSGIACHVNQHSVVLPTYNNSTCPTFPNYFLGPVVGSICDSLTTGIKTDELTLKDVRVFPNPANTSFWLNYNLPYNRDGWLRIYDVNGKLVQQRRLYWSTTQLQYYADALQNGIYFLEVQSDLGIRASTKVIISK